MSKLQPHLKPTHFLCHTQQLNVTGEKTNNYSLQIHGPNLKQAFNEIPVCSLTHWLDFLEGGFIPFPLSSTLQRLLTPLVTTLLPTLQRREYPQLPPQLLACQHQCSNTCFLSWICEYIAGPPVAQMVKNLPAMQETQVWSLGQEDPLKKGMAAHSSILAWRIPWTEEPGMLQSMGCRVEHNWATNTATHTHTHPSCLKPPSAVVHWVVSPSTYSRSSSNCSFSLLHYFSLVIIPISIKHTTTSPIWKKKSSPPVFLPGESPWTEEPGGLQSIGLQRVGRDWVTKYTNTI